VQSDEALNGSAGATRCGWMGRAYASIVEGSVCKVSDDVGIIGTMAMFAAVELYLAVLVLVYTTRRMEQEPSELNAGDVAFVKGVSLAPSV
jgi:hypothetical protein